LFKEEKKKMKQKVMLLAGAGQIGMAIAKRCNEKRVMAQSVEWGKLGARLNDIAPGVRDSRD
jgi:NAD(P)-dependent dehydrogenase (short-subunit alcohol dehydrogenase family)